MTPTTLFYVLIAILTISFIIDKILDTLNTKHFNDPIPEELNDVYDKEEYQKSQAYKKTNANFSNITGLFSFALTIVFFFFDGFKYIDNFAREYSENSIIIALIFFGLIMFGSDILSTPLSYYKTFVIEEK
ncbi:MAG: M48 family peptidase, partial [Flavobacteriaceae bacterium]